MRLLGVVLAGGESRRFGRDKALAEWRGKPLIDHVRAALEPHVAAVVISGRDLPDRPGPGMGPLGGINAGLAYATAHGFDRVITAPCDTPVLDSALLVALASAEDATFLADLPVIGSWPVALARHLDDWLAQDSDRSVRAWAAAVGAIPLAGYGAPPNINRPEDLARLG